MSVVLAIAGALVILIVLVEAFEGLVLPRHVTRRLRLTRLYYRSAWHAWTAVADLLSPGRRKETLLSVFGPLSLLVLFAIWGAGLILGFGLLHDSVSPRDGGFAQSIYFSGVTFTTLGYGDVIPIGNLSRALAVIESATGLGYFAVVISYMPVLYQAFGRRESLIAILDARASSPPSAAQMLLRFPPGPADGSIVNRLLDDAEKWVAEVLEAQLSYPVLGYYRSQHDNQNWLAAMTSILDVTALGLSVIDGIERHQARLTFAMARHALVDLSLVMRRPPGAMTCNRLPDERLKELLAALQSRGVTIHDDSAARAELTELRQLYEPFASALAGYFRLTLPDIWPTDARPDNWQTSAWMRRASPLTSLGAERGDDHFV